MRERRILPAVLAAASLSFALAPSAAQGAAGPVSYDAAGSYSMSSVCEVGVCTQVYDYTGTATCQQNCSAALSSGSFTIELGGLVGHPPNPCVSKRVSGNLTFSPTDPLYPPDPIFAALSGRSRDRKAYVVSGVVSSGAFAGGTVSVLVGLPPNPCNPGTFTGTIDFFPPDPI